MSKGELEEELTYNRETWRERKWECNKSWEAIA